MSRRGLSRGGPVTILAALALVASACLVPPSSVTAPHPHYDIADPAMVQYLSAAEVYGGSTCLTHECNSQTTNIPEYGVTLPGSSPTSVTEALATLPTWSGYNAKQVWAPSVRQIGSNWVMAYSEFYGANEPGQSNCIGWATAPILGAHFTSVHQKPFCSSVAGHGFLDPSIFTDSTGTLYLLFSEEWGTGSLSTDSTLWIAPLASNGLSVTNLPTMLLQMAQVTGQTTPPSTGIQGWCSCDAGDRPFLENPSMTEDDYNGNDLTFSLGTFNEKDNLNTDYVTGEVACPNIYPSSNCTSYVSRGKQIMGYGSASMVNDAQPDVNYMVYDEWATSSTGANVRIDEIGATTELDCNSSC